MPLTPVNIYPSQATDLNQEAADILAAFTNATAELNSQGASDALFLEIAFSGGKIIRVWDGNIVASLSSAEQKRLYPQLSGLFNLAMRTLLYP
jgi:pyruvate/2-oxoglutarate dehydrogenase complex dihydrolipoamide acyltransferase (E2) component